MQSTVDTIGDRRAPSAYAMTKAGGETAAVLEVSGLQTYLFTRAGVVKESTTSRSRCDGGRPWPLSANAAAASR